MGDTYDDSTWTGPLDDPGFGDPGFGDPGFGDPGFGDPAFGDLASGVPPVFLGFMVLVFVAGIGMTLWRLSLARKMATEAGLDPDRATAMTMLSDDGLEATYLASSLRGPVSPQQPVAAGRSVEDRLTELQRLRDQGLVTYEEYDARRKAIIDSL